MKELILLCGPCGSGKTTLREKYLRNDPSLVVISQDEQSKKHLDIFNEAIVAGKSIIVDRMSFNKEQRLRYLEPAEVYEYKTKIVVLHESYDTCLERMMKRENHPTINGLKLEHFTPDQQDDYYMSIVDLELKEKQAKSALHTFFSKYERPQLNEADEVVYLYPEGDKPQMVCFDLDGTLFNIDHRLHHVRSQEGKKKNWPAFFDGIKDDVPNPWCEKLLMTLAADPDLKIVLASGRGEEYREATEESLKTNDLNLYYDHLFMRQEKDSRQDTVIKEIILDFEILTRFTPVMFIDDRPNVCRMWRSRGYVCLQCNDIEF